MVGVKGTGGSKGSKKVHPDPLGVEKKDSKETKVVQDKLPIEVSGEPLGLIGRVCMIMQGCGAFLFPEMPKVIKSISGSKDTVQMPILQKGSSLEDIRNKADNSLSSQKGPVDITDTPDRMETTDGALSILRDHLNVITSLEVPKEKPLSEKEKKTILGLYEIGVLSAEDMKDKKTLHKEALDSLLRDLKKIGNAQLTGKEQVSKIQKACGECIDRLEKRGCLTKTKKEVYRAIQLQRGLNAPDAVTMTHQVEGNPLKETMTTVSTKIGLSYLQQIGKGFAEAYYPQNIPEGKTLQRVSEAKKNGDMQGVSMNLEEHIVEMEGQSEYMLHSGAPCTHGRGQTMEELMATKGEAANAEIDNRKRLGIAQILPKIRASILHSLETNEKIGKEGFLHTEQSLLSSDPSYITKILSGERTMALETQKVFEALEGNLTVKFGDKEGVEIKGDAIIMTLVAPEGCKGKVSKGAYPVTTALFMQGVNGAQSLSNFFALFFTNNNELQDSINRKGIETLQGYAEKKGIELTDLNTHFSKGTRRELKDQKGMDLIQDATKNLGGTVGMHCKSGKDRTGMYYSYEFARRFGENVEEIKRRLNEGLAYYSTGINTGKKRAFAFASIFQRMFLPKWLRPFSHLCGNVKG